MGVGERGECDFGFDFGIAQRRGRGGGGFDFGFGFDVGVARRRGRGGGRFDFGFGRDFGRDVGLQCGVERKAPESVHVFFDREGRGGGRFDCGCGVARTGLLVGRRNRKGAEETALLSVLGGRWGQVRFRVGDGTATSKSECGDTATDRYTLRHVDIE